MKEIEVKILEADAKKNKLIFSQRQVLAEQRDQVLDNVLSHTNWLKQVHQKIKFPDSKQVLLLLRHAAAVRRTADSANVLNDPAGPAFPPGRGCPLPLRPALQS